MTNNKQFEQIVELITQDLSSDPALQSACLKIVNYLQNQPFKEVRHLTQQSILTLLQHRFADELLINTLRYLTGNRANILETHFELIDDDDEPYYLDPSSVSSLQKTGVLYHPYTGEPVEDPTQKVYLFFSPSESFKKLQVNNAT